ncbi:hypothetical protein LC613_26010 [Nostoc sphaeroides CHAB 2801]|uniref:hypothetical protein n=1 Tax=Nostoc sphaeroides TaxID=446679 RepID=UPI0011C11B3E|nr:hypothetical protein [Nostoc sphaeroides]MCC5631229.1 hypothetical protein [Nostoc sphaeroides CHAB 2801]
MGLANQDFCPSRDVKPIELRSSGGIADELGELRPSRRRISSQAKYYQNLKGRWGNVGYSHKL